MLLPSVLRVSTGIAEREGYVLLPGLLVLLLSLSFPLQHSAGVSIFSAAAYASPASLYVPLPLHLAVERGSISVVEGLLKLRADAMVTDSYGRQHCI